MILVRADGDHEAMLSSMSREMPIVFVVDDDISVRESLESLIRTAGWQPETFESAQEFLARPRVLAPSCLILDVKLPDLNGLDLQKRVTADRTDMPIIIFFIAASFSAKNGASSMMSGADIDALWAEARNAAPAANPTASVTAATMTE